MTDESREYAEALFDLTYENNLGDGILTGLGAVSDLFTELPELISFLNSPGVSKSVRLEAVHTAFDECVHEYVVSLVCMLCEQRKMGIYSEIAKAYTAMYSEKNRVIHATITTATDLTKEEKSRLLQGLSKKFKARVYPEYNINPDILGGITVETEDTRLDGSVVGRIKALKEEMTAK